MNDSRLVTERNIWLATTRPNGKPHLIPIWFCYVQDKFYICTQDSIKVKNLRASPRASVALEDGNRPVLAEGTARFIDRPFPADVVSAFQEKYQWTIERDGEPPAEDKTYNILIEITPEKWLKW